MQNLLVELVQSIVEMPGAFEKVLTNDPLAAVLVLVGSGVMAVTFGALGYLTLGAVADLFTGDRVGPSPQREGR
jgi:energy-converting hydrogenase Eha subunit C